MKKLKLIEVLKNLYIINRNTSLMAAVLLSVASTALADKAPTGVRIVEDSEPLFEIIAPEGYTNAVKFAVEDLQHWIKEITDAKADILPAPSGTKKHAIYVGRIFAEKLFPEDMKALAGSDGYAIRFMDDNFYLFGPKDRSCIYATSRFIENNTDLIWARPNETFGTVFTKTNNLNIVKYDYVDRPAFPLHGWNVVAIRSDLSTGKWVFRNGGNEAQQTEPKGQSRYFDAMTMAGGHIYWWMAHPDKYFKTHPEFFNYSKMSQKREPNTLCLTAPGLVDLAVSNLTFRIKELYGEEGPDTFHIGFRDSTLMCQCDDCLAPIKLKDGTTIECKSLDVAKDCRYYSTRYYTFISQISDELHKVFPRTIFVGSGYLYAAQPPACDIPEYMWVDFCPIGGVDGRHPILSEKQAPVWSARLKEWAVRFPGRIYYYEYWCSYGAGHASIAGLGSWRDKMVQDMRDMKHILKGPGISCELTPDSTRKFSNHTMQSEWDGGTAYRWLCARLMWDPDQDPDALIGYCLNRTYREAAPAMKKFYEALNVHFRDPTRPGRGGIPFYATQHAKDAHAAIEEAERSVKHPTSAILIQRLKTIFMECKALSATDTVPKMDKAEHYTEHNATCWDPVTSLVQNDFRVPDYFNWGGTSVPCRATELRFLTDGKTLFIRYQADAKDCVRRQNAAGRPNGDYISIRFNFPNRQWRTITFDGTAVADSATNNVVHYPGDLADGYVGVLAVPLADLKIDIEDPKTFPEIILDRRCFDGERAEISTLKGRFINETSGKLCF